MTVRLQLTFQGAVMTSMLYPTTNPSAAEQMVVARGEGPYIFDRSGKRYLEGMAGLWCTSLGYGNEEIIETATRQMRELSFSHMFGGKTHDSCCIVTLCERSLLG